MVQILHPSASTTKATRRNIQNSQKIAMNACSECSENEEAESPDLLPPWLSTIYIPYYPYLQLNNISTEILYLSKLISRG